MSLRPNPSIQPLYDALIIGAGPAGAFLAFKLSQAGMRVLVLEKNSSIKRKVCGEYLCPQGVDLLKKEGVEFDSIGSFLPLHGMLIVTSRGTEVDTRFPGPDNYHGVSVNRELFDANLIELAKNTGAQFNFGIEVKNISQHGELWIIHTTEGDFKTRILVGADGRASVVSKIFKNDCEISARRVALHAFVKSKSVNQRRGEMHLFADGAYIGLNPIHDNEINFSLVLQAEDLKSLGGPYKAINKYVSSSTNLRRRLPEFNDNIHISAAYPIQHKTKSITPHHRVALVGDAAGFVDPLTGEGLYNALLSSQILAQELTSVYKQQLNINQAAFVKYKIQYAKVLRQKIWLNKVFQWLIRQPQLIELLARFLLKNKNRSDTFIGIIGNIYSPLIGLYKLILNKRSTT